LRQEFNLVHQGSAAANKVGILMEGMEFQETQIAPEDAQFLASRQFQVIEICRILRLAPHKLADFTQSHLTNIEASNEDHISSCLRPWSIRFEQAVDLKLLTADEFAAGFYTKHDFRPLLLSLSKDRADYYRKMWEVGIYNVNEIRELEGLNPISDEDGGNLRFRPANVMGLTDDGSEAEENDVSFGKNETKDRNPRGLRELLGNGHAA
jgi:HK97 family phage portal protein